MLPTDILADWADKYMFDKNAIGLSFLSNKTHGFIRKPSDARVINVSAVFKLETGQGFFLLFHLGRQTHGYQAVQFAGVDRMPRYFVKVLSTAGDTQNR